MSDQDNIVQNTPPVTGGAGSQAPQGQMPTDTAATEEKKKGFLSKILSGAKKEATAGEKVKTQFLKPYLPSDLVGGEIPFVVGREDEAVWNAAAQACGTERVHYCYSIAEDRCWYLATPASSMANAPDSWCPLAAALPGNSEHWDKETVYLYEQDGAASALRWDPETGRMQVFLGAARTIMPRIQSLDASFVTINADVAKPIAWKNRALRQEQLSRTLTKWLFLSGLAVTLVAMLFWFGSFTMAAIFKPQLEEAKKKSQEASLNLMKRASEITRSSVSTHIARINELSLDLNAVGGELLRYEVGTDEKVEWEAIVPRAMEGDISRFGAKAEGLDEKQRGYLRIKGAR